MPTLRSGHLLDYFSLSSAVLLLWLLEKIAVMLVTSSADPPQIYSERVRKLSGLNHTKLEQDGGNPARLIQLEQDGGNPVRLIQDLLQA